MTNIYNDKLRTVTPVYFVETSTTHICKFLGYVKWYKIRTYGH